MVSTKSLNKALRHGTLKPVLENSEAVLYYSESRSYECGNNYNIDLKAGEYIAVSKEIKFDVWTCEVQNSTKGNFKRAKKAFEKYSPVTMQYLRSAM